jgi:hypothetical protein
MPEFAQFLVIRETDNAITLSPGGPIPSKGYLVDLPNLHRGGDVVVMCKVSGDSGARLSISTTSTTSNTVGGLLVNFVLDSSFTKPRSWHETAPGSVFDTSTNKLEVSLGTNPAPGLKVVFSDIVFLYHART